MRGERETSARPRADPQGSGFLRSCQVLPEFHIIDHELAQWCDGVLLAYLPETD